MRRDEASSSEGSQVRTAPVSVVIPCFRANEVIGEALESVVAQSRPPAEIIVVDDASGEDSVQELGRLIASFAGANIRLIELGVNSGPGHARNVGWDAATQPWVAFLDADDSWHPDKIRIQLGRMESEPRLDLASHQRVRRSTSAVSRRFSPDEVTWEDIKPNSLLWLNRIVTSSVMVRRELDERFPPRRYSEDYSLWLRLAFDGRRMAISEAALGFIDETPFVSDGLSSNLWKMRKGEFQNYRELHSSGRISGVVSAAASGLAIVKFALVMVPVSWHRFRATFRNRSRA